jgi:hypothetical protein
MERADALARELSDVAKSFESWTEKELPGVNSALTEKRMEVVKALTREEWEKQ